MIDKELYINPAIVTRQFGKIKVHGISTGMLKVKKSHYNPSLGPVQILLDSRWTTWLPVYTWVIEHPEGIFLIDTGENTRVMEEDYFDCGGSQGWVSKKIIRFGIAGEQELPHQLKTLGITPDDINKVVLTHLHIDHTDGLKFFPKSEIIISNDEFKKPFGAVPCTFPSSFTPNLINTTQEKHHHFEGCYPLTKAGDLLLVPTPGHTHAHQSVLLTTDEIDILFAGDVSFDDEQLKTAKVAGICVNKKKAKETLLTIQNYCKTRPTIYLPTHDINAGNRLLNCECS